MFNPPSPPCHSGRVSGTRCIDSNLHHPQPRKAQAGMLWQARMRDVQITCGTYACGSMSNTVACSGLRIHDLRGQTASQAASTPGPQAPASVFQDRGAAPSAPSAQVWLDISCHGMHVRSLPCCGLVGVRRTSGRQGKHSGADCSCLTGWTASWPTSNQTITSGGVS